MFILCTRQSRLFKGGRSGSRAKVFVYWIFLSLLLMHDQPVKPKLRPLRSEPSLDLGLVVYTSFVFLHIVFLHIDDAWVVCVEIYIGR